MPPALLWRMWEPEDGRPLLLAFFFFWKSLGEGAPHNWQTSCLLCSVWLTLKPQGMVSLHGLTRHRVPVSPEKVSRFLRKSRCLWPGKKGLSSLLGLTNAPVLRALWKLGTRGCWHSGTSAWPSCRRRGVNRARLPHPPSSWHVAVASRWAPLVHQGGLRGCTLAVGVVKCRGKGWREEGRPRHEDAFDQGGDWATPYRINAEPEGRAFGGTGAS